MARIRSIKPEFWTDGTMIGLSFGARLFYIGTWNFSLCDRGHLPDDAVGLKLKILPADPVDGHQLLAELLITGRLVRRRSADGRSYLYNPRLSEHQKTDPRWKSRCPHCASEESGGFVDDPVGLPEPPPTSPEPTETPRTSAMDRKGEERIGIHHATRGAAPSAASTITQRAKRITDSYSTIEPMSKWPAVNAIVIKAIKTERWSDDEIAAALLRLAGEGRPVTVDALRVELTGLQPRASPNGRLVEVGGLKLKPETAARMADRSRFEAMDRAKDQPAIEGPT